MDFPRTFYLNSDRSIKVMKIKPRKINSITSNLIKLKV